LTKDGRPSGSRNGWVDRDKLDAKAIYELGWHLDAGKQPSHGGLHGRLSRSLDGGKTWIDDVSPPQWKFTVEDKGKKWLRRRQRGIGRASSQWRSGAALRH